MARVKVTSDFDAVKIKRDLRLNRNDLKKSGEFIVGEILDLVIKSRRFKQNSTGSTPMPRLKKSYRKQRTNKSFQKKARSPFFNPNLKRSNLSVTGQLLKSMTSKVLQRRQEIEIFFRGKRRGESLTNDELFEYLVEKDKGYNILKIGRKQLIELLDRIEKLLDQKLK